MNVQLFAKRNASTVLTCLGGVGVEIREPMGMKYEERKAFLGKIDELKSTWK